jgi:hypothetical protein
MSGSNFVNYFWDTILVLEPKANPDFFSGLKKNK